MDVLQDKNDVPSNTRRSSTTCRKKDSIISEHSSSHDNCSERSTRDMGSDIEHVHQNSSLSPEPFNIDNTTLIETERSPNSQQTQCTDVESGGEEHPVDNHTVSIDNGASRHTLKTEDTLIINSDPDFNASERPVDHLKESLTRMPSSFCDLRSSMRSNETLKLHHNLTLLLETTRVAISHDEKEIEKLDQDIRRLRSKCVIDSVRTERLTTRWRNMADILCKWEAWETKTDISNY